MQYRSKNSIKLNIVLGELIRKKRLKNYDSGHKFSCEYGIDSGHYSRIENGKIDCKITTFYKLAQALGLKPSKLMELLEQELGENFSLIDD